MSSNLLNRTAFNRLTSRPVANPPLQHRAVEQNITTRVPVDNAVPGQPDPLANASTASSMTVNVRQKRVILANAEAYIEELPEFYIERVIHSLWSDEEILAETDIEINIKEDSTELHAVNDARMGVVEQNKLCLSCHLDNFTCQGHIGYIHLGTKIILPNISVIKLIIRVLTVICNSCGELILTPWDLKRLNIRSVPMARRLELLVEKSKGKMCQHKHKGNVVKCRPNPEYLLARTQETGRIIARVPGNKKSEFEVPVAKVDKILKCISDETADIMGFSNGAHPKRAVREYWIVPPPCIRPPVPQDGLLGPDDFTLMLMDIVGVNNNLKATTDPVQRDRLISQLTFKLSHMIDNSDKKYGLGQRKEFVSVKDRTMGKEGHIRKSIMGKTNNYVLRSVLTSAPWLNSNQIAVPEMAAPLLTIRAYVNSFNRDQLQALLRAGKVRTIYIKQQNSNKKTPTTVDDKNRNTYQLVPGDECERHLQNGDYVLFNRQPTLSVA